jgi:hypothetical protein
MAPAPNEETPRQVYEGRGEKFEDALQDCAEQAVSADERNLGATFQVVRYEVVVDNPRISEHKVAIMK